jgi:CPA2 family monovalent cation:H+ antiporter-2
MHHDTPLISTIVVGLVLAFIFGRIAHRLRMPPLVGYLVAGVLVGPFTPGFVADGKLANELSEIGVILLMFGVGLHFSLKDLLSVRAIAIPGAVVQIGGATLMGLGLGLLMGWSIGAGLIFGLALSVASTVVLLKAMQDRRLMDSERGRVAVGWLIVEDLAMVLALVLIPSLASIWGMGGEAVHDPVVDLVESVLRFDIGIAGILAVTVLKLAAFVGFMLIVGRRFIPWLLHSTAHTGSRELFRLAVLAIALGVAAGAAYLFGVSLALGAFFAGMVLSESELSHRAAEESLPLRDAFAVLFFVAVGMLFDPMIVITQPLPLLATLFIILVGKSLLAFLIVVAFKRPASMALTISASLAQIGEFSFILAALGVSLGILPSEGRDLILAGAILSIVLNPVMFWVTDRVRPLLERPEPSAPAAPAARPEPTALSGHIIVIGYGRVGSVIAAGLKARSLPFLVIEDADDRVEAARGEGMEVIAGNAAADALALANVGGARAAFVAIPNAFEAAQATEQCRKLNPQIRIVARAHSDQEEAYLGQLGADKVIMGEREIGLGMLDWLDDAPVGSTGA